MNEKIENLLKEERKFPPSQELIENANASCGLDTNNPCLLYTSPSPRD